MGKQDGLDRRVSDVDIDDSAATILHVDMDAFFASVELLDHPELRGKPVIVGVRSARSIVTAATYEARRFGINSALPMSVALRRCPHAIVLEPHFERYVHYSHIVMGIFDGITPRVERLGIDEAFLDVAGASRVFGSPMQAARLVRARVASETGLICSVGAAAVKFVAKVASGMSKPDGLLVVPAAATIEFLHPLPIARLWGVGGKTEAVLRARGYRTIGDLARAPIDVLRSSVGDAAAVRLHDLAWGIDPRVVRAGAAEKSVGHEVTFETDVTDPQVIRRELLRMSSRVAVRLRTTGVLARTVVFKVRLADFTTQTRSRTLSQPTDLGRRIYDEVAEIFEGWSRNSPAVRLVGVRAEQLTPAGSSTQALWDDSDGWRNAEHVMDAASAKFGSGAVQPARLLGTGSAARPSLGQRD